MTKTFMTATGANRQLQIKRSDDAVMIRQFDPEFHTHQAKTFFLNPSDAPALALAILEAAYGEDQPAPNKIGEAWAALYAHIAEEESRAAEAKELAELEAEALDLFNTARATRDIDPLEWDEVADKDTWVAVARRAREMRAEK